MEANQLTVGRLKEEARTEQSSSSAFVSFKPDSLADEQAASGGKALGVDIAFPNGVRMAIGSADSALMATVLQTLQKGGK